MRSAVNYVFHGEPNGAGNNICNRILQYKITVAIFCGCLIAAPFFITLITVGVKYNWFKDSPHFPKISVAGAGLNEVPGEKQQSIRVSLFCTFRTIPVTICPKSSREEEPVASACFIQNVSQAETVIGQWALKKEDEKENRFFQFSGNNITLLNDFEGNLIIDASMYRLVTDRYGFVLNLNGVPNTPCVFQQRKEKFSATTGFCKWARPKHWYRLDKTDSYLLTPVNYNRTEKLNKGTVITITYFGVIKENPTISFDGIFL